MRILRRTSRHTRRARMSVPFVLVTREAKLYNRADPMLEAADKDCVGADCAGQGSGVHILQAQVERDEGKLELSLQHALLAIDQFDALRSNIEFTDKRMASYNALSGDYYALLIEVLSRLGRPEEALLATEQYRSRAFVDLATSPHLDAVPDAGKTIELTNPEQVGALPSRGGAKVKEGISLDLRSQPHPFTMTFADMHRIVEQQHSTLVSYWISGDKLYTWVMTPGKPVFATNRTIDAKASKPWCWRLCRRPRRERSALKWRRAAESRSLWCVRTESRGATFTIC